MTTDMKDYGIQIGWGCPILKKGSPQLKKQITGVPTSWAHGDVSRQLVVSKEDIQQTSNEDILFN